MSDITHAPFPYNGGKAKVADVVWDRFGKTDYYIEPFAGSCAVLLNCPYELKNGGVINDKNGMLINFWRSMKYCPDKVETHIPPFDHEADLAAWHSLLHEEHNNLVGKVQSDTEYCDPEYAARWVHGMSTWNCGSWSNPRKNMRKPNVTKKGIIGIRAKSRRERLGEVFQSIQNKLEYFSIVCGDWKRPFNEGVLKRPDCLGIFLDPPYSHEDRDTCYGTFDDRSLSEEVEDFALTYGNDDNKRIAVCGYEGEYDFPDTWEQYSWSTQTQYGELESIWFSPHCHSNEGIVDMFTT